MADGPGLGALSSGSTALASHGVKAGLRILINTMPEPFSNIAVSLTEDGLVATVVGFSINYPLLAFAIAATLLVAGIIVLILLYRRLIAAIRRMREKGGTVAGR